MGKEPVNGERRIATAIGLYVLRSANVILALIAAVGVMWIKVNVPSKEDFKDLQGHLRSLELTVLQFTRTQERVEDFEARIRKLEQGELRRFPPRRDP